MALKILLTYFVILLCLSCGTSADKIIGSVYVQNNTIGFASYHFESGEHSYISFAESFYNSSRLDNGERIPARKYFTNFSVNENKRIVKGDIIWAPTAWLGDALWSYEMHFSDDLSSIISGKVVAYDRVENGNITYTGVFGVDMIYKRWKEFSSESPTDQPTDRPTEGTTADCEDINTRCSEWRTYCTSATYKDYRDYMKTNCKKTCGHCNKVTPEYECSFVPGDGDGGTETEINIFGHYNVNDCIKECVERKGSNSNINGVTVTVGGRNCFCEMNMDSVSSLSGYKTCFLKTKEIGTTRSPWRPRTTRSPWRPRTTRQPKKRRRKKKKKRRRKIGTTRPPWRPRTTSPPWRPWRPRTTRSPSTNESVAEKMNKLRGEVDALHRQTRNMAKYGTMLARNIHDRVSTLTQSFMDRSRALGEEIRRLEGRVMGAKERQWERITDVLRRELRGITRSISSLQRQVDNVGSGARTTPRPINGNGEEMCEGHNYGRNQCQAVGCCDWDWNNGNCWSNVGTGPCIEIRTTRPPWRPWQPRTTISPPSCPAETGQCVSRITGNQPSRGWKYINPISSREDCLSKCHATDASTGCEYKVGSYCAVHTVALVNANGRRGTSCWVFSRCEQGTTRPPWRPRTTRPSGLVPYTEITGGTCQSVSKEDCKVIASKKGLRFEEFSSGAYPLRCYYKVGNEVYYNTAGTSTSECTVARRCICKEEIRTTRPPWRPWRPRTTRPPGTNESVVQKMNKLRGEVDALHRQTRVMVSSLTTFERKTQNNVYNIQSLTSRSRALGEEIRRVEGRVMRENERQWERITDVLRRELRGIKTKINSLQRQIYHIIGSSARTTPRPIAEEEKCWWAKKSPSCVLGRNIVKYDDKSVAECKRLCTADPNCLAFEYYQYHGGRSTLTKPRDCWLQSSANSRGCDGRRYNFDLHVKGDCTYEIGTTRSPWQPWTTRSPEIGPTRSPWRPQDTTRYPRKRNINIEWEDIVV